MKSIAMVTSAISWGKNLAARSKDTILIALEWTGSLTDCLVPSKLDVIVQ